MRQTYSALVLGVALSVIAAGSAEAQGKSKTKGKSAAASVSSPSQGPANSYANSISNGFSDESNGFSVGVDGKLQGSFSKPLNDSTSFYMNGGFDRDLDTNGDVRGTVGLRFKF